MEDVLSRIVAAKRKEVEALHTKTPQTHLEKYPLFKRTPYSLCNFIRNPFKTGIIAEFKRKSPSKGYLKMDAVPKIICQAYFQHGASGLSVLTDNPFFGGSLEDLEEARLFTPLPILRKEFIVDTLQIYETKAIGADALLLIAECLSAQEIKEFASLAGDLGLEVLLEVHGREQLDKWVPGIGLIGVNNRNLKTMSVSVQQSHDLLPHLPQESVKISESGLRNPSTLVSLRKAGFDGFLIGEHFMTQEDTPDAVASFMEEFIGLWIQHNLDNGE